MEISPHVSLSRAFCAGDRLRIDWLIDQREGWDHRHAVGQLWPHHAHHHHQPIVIHHPHHHPHWILNHPPPCHVFIFVNQLMMSSTVNISQMGYQQFIIGPWASSPDYSISTRSRRILPMMTSEYQSMNQSRYREKKLWINYKHGQKIVCMWKGLQKKICPNFLCN